MNWGKNRGRRGNLLSGNTTEAETKGIEGHFWAYFPVIPTTDSHTRQRPENRGIPPPEEKRRIYRKTTVERWEGAYCASWSTVLFFYFGVPKWFSQSILEKNSFLAALASGGEFPSISIKLRSVERWNVAWHPTFYTICSNAMWWSVIQIRLWLELACTDIDWRNSVAFWLPLLNNAAFSPWIARLLPCHANSVNESKTKARPSWFYFFYLRDVRACEPKQYPGFFFTCRRSRQVLVERWKLLLLLLLLWGMGRWSSLSELNITLSTFTIL